MQLPTRNQHFVPRVYLKAWETKVETKQDPGRQFNGVYYLKKEDTIGEGATREAILWEPHLYTIGFRQLFLGKECPRIYNYFVNEVFNLMRDNRPQPVYGKLGYSVIKTKSSIRKHLYDINDWDFYYDDGNVARKRSLLNRFNDIRCYLLEDAFSSVFESKWGNILKTFIDEVENVLITPGLETNRKISEKAAEDMMEFFFMMLCRSPQFDAMGIYTWMNDILQQTLFIPDEADGMIEAVWLTELYRMFYKRKGGFYHTALVKTIENCQFILFKTYPNAGSFITSDNPAFQHISNFEVNNMNGYYFPISPNYMLLIVKGSSPVNVISYRMANRDLVRKFNQVIASHSKEKIVSMEKDRNKIL